MGSYRLYEEPPLWLDRAKMLPQPEGEAAPTMLDPKDQRLELSVFNLEEGSLPYRHGGDPRNAVEVAEEHLAQLENQGIFVPVGREHYIQTNTNREEGVAARGSTLLYTSRARAIGCSVARTNFHFQQNGEMIQNYVSRSHLAEGLYAYCDWTEGQGDRWMLSGIFDITAYTYGRTVYDGSKPKIYLQNSTPSMRLASRSAINGWRQLVNGWLKEKNGVDSVVR